MTSSLSNGCSVCGSTAIDPCIRIDAMPVYCNVLWPSVDDAKLAVRGDIDLWSCRECGHFFNRSFDPDLTDYAADYDNSLHFSPRFNDYALDLARRLVERYAVRHKDVLELGCGKGDFLRMLCEVGENRGVGFDRSYDPSRGIDPESRADVRFVQDFYSEEYADVPADLVCCRHVLEHVADPRAFLARLRRALGSRSETVVYFEVPNVMFTLRELGIWDLIYEHCGYFSPLSLRRVFFDAGFEVLDEGEAFGGQFLFVEARPSRHDDGGVAPGDPAALQELIRLSAAFKRRYEAKVAEWRARLRDYADGNVRAAAWGGGSKGVTFLNVVGRGECPVELIVDVNPHKQGKFVPGSGQEVVPPERMKTYQPEQVIVMNRIYLDEIGRTLDEMGVRAQVVAV